jgi:L-ascorbate oxidase
MQHRRLKQIPRNAMQHSTNDTNMHLHGLHVSSTLNSDNVFLTVQPSSEFTYEYEIPATHSPGLFWYHPHIHGAASVHLASGLAGLLIIDAAAGNGVLDQMREVPMLLTRK